MLIKHRSCCPAEPADGTNDSKKQQHDIACCPAYVGKVTVTKSVVSKTCTDTRRTVQPCRYVSMDYPATWEHRVLHATSVQVYKHGLPSKMGTQWHGAASMRMQSSHMPASLQRCTGCKMTFKPKPVTIQRDRTFEPSLLTTLTHVRRQSCMSKIMWPQVQVGTGSFGTASRRGESTAGNPRASLIQQLPLAAGISLAMAP
jgi:hypothetical protein